MTGRRASLPMYDADVEAVEAWWHAVAEACRDEGIDDVPRQLEWPADLDAHWRDPQLLLSQTCGYPLMTRLRDAVQVVGAFRYDVEGCSGIDYSSVLIARTDETGHSLDAFAGRVVAVSDPASQSGCNVLRAMLRGRSDATHDRFFGRWIVSGAHRRSIEMVRAGHADIAAIDCVTLAGLRRQRPGIFDGLRVIGPTIRSPGLPLITSAVTSTSRLAALRRALRSACADPRRAALRERLFIGGFEAVDALTWRSIEIVPQPLDASIA